MAIGIYCDVHIPEPITAGLRRRGVHVLTAREDGSRRWTDRSLLSRATSLGMMFYTHDDDLLAEANRRSKIGEPFSGVVFSRALASPVGRCIDDLEIIAKSLEPEELKNRIEYIPF